jgi:hypothetical protein
MHAPSAKKNEDSKKKQQSATYQQTTRARSLSLSLAGEQHALMA